MFMCMHIHAHIYLYVPYLYIRILFYRGPGHYIIRTGIYSASGPMLIIRLGSSLHSKYFAVENTECQEDPSSPEARSGDAEHVCLAPRALPLPTSLCSRLPSSRARSHREAS